ncbi:bifunctional phosphopantothenoylcysteine decarboxylase/phosphopantothenate--cysteine ligase CoaBC [Candidiatus Paracoxiella cheracis]|uniref:bifunctional phosphopantothenoylcysteine decarboxylase/phosphopantothenate--cysteine ligase CoaBC n=1 Tax=Candidiatus Paracoxiella cheracis TaxID=3405120 RepID=UPI003BF4E36E
MLKGKKILVGVSGGIAAYKSADLVRRLKKAGADVRVAMTTAAKEFITPLTLQAVSGHRVYHQLLSEEAEAGMGHIELARWADFIVIAPASADFIARVAHGMANDLLATLCLATTAPIALAPAMNQQMWLNVITRDNVQRLKHRDMKIFGPAEGEQACGETGPGRMLEPEELVACIAEYFASDILSGQNVIITAGPTREAIDPVRFLSNRSSGKMGIALARAAQAAGADVTLIRGPTALSTPAGVHSIDVTSAEEMYDAVMEKIDACDIFIGAAAVSDYCMETIAEHKIKKTAETMILQLKRNPDIIKSVAALKNKPIVIGFAAETDRVIDYAQKKLAEKNLDMIIANQVGPGQGFESDENAVVVIHRDGQFQEIPLARKSVIATRIVALISEYIVQKKHERDNIEK